VVAPELTKASVCTFLLYIQSVTGMLKEVFLLHTTLLQDSSITFECFELIGGILSSDCKLQTLFSIVLMKNPSYDSLFSSYSEG